MSDYRDGLLGLNLRGSRVNDPDNTTADGFSQVDLAILVADAWPDNLGEMIADGNGSISAFYSARESVEFEVMTFTKSIADGDDTLMHGGHIRKAMAILRLPFVWIYSLWKDGGNTGAGYNERAIRNPIYDPEDEESEEYVDTYWRHNLTDGQLPMPIVWDGEGRPEHIGGGLYDWTFKVLKITQEAS